MRRSPISLIALILTIGICGCGENARSTRSTAVVSAATAAADSGASTKGFKPRMFGDYDTDDEYNDSLHGDADNDDHKPTDRDNDSDNPTHNYYDSDDDAERRYGHAASAPVRRVVTALVKRYFAAAIARDGASACTMIYPAIANSIPETLGGSAGPPDLRGSKTCPEIMTKLFEQNHAQLSVYARLLQIDAVRVDGKRALTILRFKGLPARQIAAELEHGVWTIEGLLDSELP